MFNKEMPYDNDIDINITNQNVNTNTNTNSFQNFETMGTMSMSNPIVEPGRERCVYRNIYHEVPQE